MIVPVIPRWRVDRNPYTVLYVDLTERCNMDCNFCYTPEHLAKDMALDYFAEVCRRLPGPVLWRFLGGEPTLHPHFFEFIGAALNAGHKVHVISNGLKWLDDDFVERFKPYSGKVGVTLSMDGGTANRRFYRLINNRDYLDKKLQALENLDRHGIKRVGVSATIVRGRNEQVIGELYDLAKRYRHMVRWIHYRNAALLGRWVDTVPYDLEGLKELAGTVFTTEEFKPLCIGEINCNGGEGTCCYRFRPTRWLQVSLIEFASERSTQCPYRGKLREEGFMIEPLFAQMIQEGQVLGEVYGKVEVGAEGAHVVL